jgi:hypothetical protein
MSYTAPNGDVISMNAESRICTKDRVTGSCSGTVSGNSYSPYTCRLYKHDDGNSHV